MKNWGNNQPWSIVQSIGRGLLDFILPPKCLNCKTRIDQPHSICPDCWKKLYFITNPKCSLCGFPFENDMGNNFALKDENLCGQCQTTKRSFDQAVSALRYDDESRKMIIGFKHNDQLEYGGYFVKLLQQAGSELLEKADYIIPVPLHRRRLLKRRYNQSAVISRTLSKNRNITHVPDLLVRVKNTPPQEGNIRKRSTNVKGAFRVNRKYENLIQGQRILLVDDVFTTGSTVENCSKVLKKAGASHVYVLTVFRVVTPQNPN